ncbi:hypothetical protein [Sporosarcina sp. HYO08]|uniref:hypothetical protein n=1 Tax=Sporosarcina sp. HYO08 TaxID=1759557 RepID=UPI000799447B|nr:hypothetical protein [Sporosarcina sp. HYO08]KXH78575.1 hypothetical protein AU377_12915 [Sporosarcina sp. HYO08]
MSIFHRNDGFGGCSGCGRRSRRQEDHQCTPGFTFKPIGPFTAIDRRSTQSPCPPACDIQTRTFTNPANIVIPDSGPATPYPSPITVSGMTGNIVQVTVRLINLSHEYPDDIDIMLVGPSGQNATIMSDVGGSDDVTNITLTLDDLAPTAMPGNNTLFTGTFKPTNAGAVFDNFPDAPSPSGGSMLSSFNFTDPNGTWNLYVIDDEGSDSGSIAGGWELTITTSNCTP